MFSSKDALAPPGPRRETPSEPAPAVPELAAASLPQEPNFAHSLAQPRSAQPLGVQSDLETLAAAPEPPAFGRRRPEEASGKTVALEFPQLSGDNNIAERSQFDEGLNSQERQDGIQSQQHSSGSAGQPEALQGPDGQTLRDSSFGSPILKLLPSASASPIEMAARNIERLKSEQENMRRASEEWRAAVTQLLLAAWHKEGARLSSGDSGADSQLSVDSFLQVCNRVRQFLPTLHIPDDKELVSLSKLMPETVVTWASMDGCEASAPNPPAPQQNPAGNGGTAPQLNGDNVPAQIDQLTNFGAPIRRAFPSAARRHESSQSQVVVGSQTSQVENGKQEHALAADTGGSNWALVDFDTEIHIRAQAKEQYRIGHLPRCPPAALAVPGFLGPSSAGASSSRTESSDDNAETYFVSRDVRVGEFLGQLSGLVAPQPLAEGLFKKPGGSPAFRVWVDPGLTLYTESALRISLRPGTNRPNALLSRCFDESSGRPVLCIFATRNIASGAPVSAASTSDCLNLPVDEVIRGSYANLHVAEYSGLDGPTRRLVARLQETQRRLQGARRDAIDAAANMQRAVNRLQAIETDANSVAKTLLEERERLIEGVSKFKDSSDPMRDLHRVWTVGPPVAVAESSTMNAVFRAKPQNTTIRGTMYTTTNNGTMYTTKNASSSTSTMKRSAASVGGKSPSHQKRTKTKHGSKEKKLKSSKKDKKSSSSNKHRRKARAQASASVGLASGTKPSRVEATTANLLNAMVPEEILAPLMLEPAHLLSPLQLQHMQIDSRDTKHEPLQLQQVLQPGVVQRFRQVQALPEQESHVPEQQQKQQQQQQQQQGLYLQQHQLSFVQQHRLDLENLQQSTRDQEVGQAYFNTQISLERPTVAMSAASTSDRIESANQATAPSSAVKKKRAATKKPKEQEVVDDPEDTVIVRRRKRKMKDYTGTEKFVPYVDPVSGQPHMSLEDLSPEEWPIFSIHGGSLIRVTRKCDLHSHNKKKCDCPVGWTCNSRSCDCVDRVWGGEANLDMVQKKNLITVLADARAKVRELPNHQERPSKKRGPKGKRLEDGSASGIWVDSDDDDSQVVANARRKAKKADDRSAITDNPLETNNHEAVPSPPPTPPSDEPSAAPTFAN